MSASTPARAANGGWARRYPPLLVMAIAVALAIFALPSALNLPQANPSQTLEYAPIPGDSAQSASGNLAALGLGSTGTLPGIGGLAGSDAGGAGAPPPPPLQGEGLNPSNKHCVGSPPRQTEDPLSPPCVAFFSGDNGGATYQGVSAGEVNVLFYTAGPHRNGNCVPGTSEGCSPYPPTGMYDLDKPSDANQFIVFRMLHDWSVYFNARYQTYNRHVHFWAYHNGDIPPFDPVTAAQADAAASWNARHPFADQAAFVATTDPLSYMRYMAQRRTISFGTGGGVSMVPASFYRDFPGLFWGFEPPIETWAQMYASYVCARVKPNPVSFSSTYPAGTPRKYGLLFTTDSTWPDAVQFGKVVQPMLQSCGVEILTSHGFPHAASNYTSGDESIAIGNMSDFQNNKVTTILMADGVETDDEHAAESLNYYPEWVVAGIVGVDGNLDGSAATPKEWSNAWVVTPRTMQNADGYPVESACYDALIEVNPAIDKTFDLEFSCAYFYDNLRQMFIGIQLAGPKLTPTSMDQGFHAIPGRPSTDPSQPSCFYPANDYTCVKDAVAEWWDPNAHPASKGAAGGTNGCWRMWLNGRRFRPGDWPAGNVTDAKNPGGDTCNLFAGGLGFNAAPPGG